MSRLVDPTLENSFQLQSVIVLLSTSASPLYKGSLLAQNKMAKGRSAETQLGEEAFPAPCCVSRMAVAGCCVPLSNTCRDLVWARHRLTTLPLWWISCGTRDGLWFLCHPYASCGGMDDPRSGIMPAEGLDKCELTEGVHTRSAFHGISQRVLGALKTTEVQHEIFRSWGSYQLMAVIFHPILQPELPSRAVTVIMGITGSGIMGKGRGSQLKNGALKAGCGMVRNISWKLLCCSDFPVAWSVLAGLLSLVEGVFLCNEIHLLTLAGLEQTPTISHLGNLAFRTPCLPLKEKWEFLSSTTKKVILIEMKLGMKCECDLI